MAAARQSILEKKLMMLVFDFDHTLVDDNVDTSICKLSPGGDLPDEVHALYRDDGWIEFMGAVFQHLHKHGVSPDDFQRHVQALPLVHGMEELFDYVRLVGGFDVVIISDANTVFIEYVLKHRNLDSLVTKVFTNPAEFDINGCLKIQNFHTQNWCSLSTINLCKGRILQDYIQLRKDEGITYSHVFYVGDGSNDLCPGLTLQKQDYLLPRKGYSLWKRLQKIREKKIHGEEEDVVVANVHEWSSAIEIRSLLETLITANLCN